MGRRLANDARHEKARALARELLNDWDTFWDVLDHPELPLTNNEAYAARGISKIMPRPGLCRMTCGKRCRFRRISDVWCTLGRHNQRSEVSYF